MKVGQCRCITCSKRQAPWSAIRGVGVIYMSECDVFNAFILIKKRMEECRFGKDLNSVATEIMVNQIKLYSIHYEQNNIHDVKVSTMDDESSFIIRCVYAFPVSNRMNNDKLNRITTAEGSSVNEYAIQASKTLLGKSTN